MRTRRIALLAVIGLVAGTAITVGVRELTREDGARTVLTTEPATTDARAQLAPAGASPSPTATARTPTRKPVSKPPRQPSTRPSPAAPPDGRRGLLVHRLDGVGDAQQVISVVAAGYGTSYASVEAFTRTSDGWRRTFGPWPARVGRAGFAPSGAKREGDGRTPSGSYGFQFMFGTKPNPGVRYEYRRVTGDHHVWADDPGTPRYNLWSDTRHQNAGPTPESMNQRPAYHHSAVIAYNTARTPGLGSAIFLHVSTGGSTAGCVSLPESQLLSVLRWLDPSKAPRIVMGTRSAVT